MLLSIDDLAERLMYTNADGERVPVIVSGAIKVAARRGQVDGMKDERGRWLIDDESEGVRKWFAKKVILESDARRVMEERHHKENIDTELRLLRKEKRELTDLCERLREQLAQEQTRSKELESHLTEMRQALTDSANQLEQERKISEERLNMVETLAKALSGGQKEVVEGKPRTDANRSAKRSLNTLDGQDLLNAWKQYEAQEEAAGHKPSKAAFARAHGMAPSTFKGRLASAQQVVAEDA